MKLCVSSKCKYNNLYGNNKYKERNGMHCIIRKVDSVGYYIDFDDGMRGFAFEDELEFLYVEPPYKLIEMLNEIKI